ncbi:MAG: hypothetical protein IKR52_05520 [Paludibacteraceae bacterium]|nr:hypothetical protein [Paludibacteraceae bacterium]MDD6357301.1 hypothetical protein [Bacteroidales bacterium]
MNLINKLPKIALYALSCITIIIGLLFYFGPEATTSYNNIEYVEPAFTNAIMIWTYVLVGIAVVITLGFVIYHFILSAMKDPKSAVKPIVVIVGIVLLFLVAYLLGDGTPLNIPGYDGADNVYSWLKITDMFLFVTYTLLVIAFALIIYSNVAKYIKK